MPERVHRAGHGAGNLAATVAVTLEQVEGHALRRLRPDAGQPTELGDEIPATLYAAVAEVLAYVFQLRHFKQVGGAYPNAPTTLPVPPELDPLQSGMGANA